MAAGASRLQALLYKSEVSWGENSTDMSSAVRIQAREPVSLDGFDHSMIEPARTVQYKNERTAGIPGPQSASFQFSVYLCGHQTSTSGATSMTALGNLLAWVFGGGNVSAASGTTIDGAGSTTTNFVTTASGTFDPGSLFRLGAIGDGDGEAQWYVTNTHTLTDLLSKVAAPGAPAAGAVVYSAETIHTLETTHEVTPKRFLIQTHDTQWIAHGCFPMAIALSGLNPGELPIATITVGASWFEPVSQTFPNATAATVNTTTPSPNALGSVNFQDYGTTTRNALSIRSCAIDFKLGVVPTVGIDGVSQYQKIVGAKRTDDTCSITLTVDAGGASATPTYWTSFLSNAAKHLLISFSTAAGQSWAVYLPRCFYAGKRPTQMDMDGINRLSFQVSASTDGSATTDDLTLSSFRLGLA